MRLNPTALTAALWLALLTACASPPPPAASTPPGPALPPAGADTCRAADFASYLGRNYRDVPPAPEGLSFRVACTTCAVTEDFSETRLNFYYDETSGRIVQLTCG